ncbi:hypothetical protein GCM10025868_44540 [Angustibacter aerolatus]|uniref:DUF4192 domain-containing protein n=1 Tax=Angustibacter aerolatus TaxID=1162965 RepID=A0ABQ6JMQ8_9ACTN|nr:hypothetical protein GCM10025868_44540 [Angustibacter aerolatus]
MRDVLLDRWSGWRAAVGDADVDDLDDVDDSDADHAVDEAAAALRRLGGRMVPVDRAGEESPASRLVGTPDGVAAVGGLLTRLCTLAPDALAAPVATMLAVHHWTRGDGPLAAVACERALEVDAGYPLAVLVDEALRTGVVPRWASAVDVRSTM